MLTPYPNKAQALQANPADPKKKSNNTFALLLGPVLFALVYLFMPAESVGEQGRAVLACTAWIAAWWITEAIPIPATSLLPIILFPVTGALEARAATAAYGDSTVFLFLGGFVMALAMEKWNLHRRIALHIIAAVGTNVRMIVLGFMLATGFLSLWISNTATAMMMLPIGLAVVTQLQALLQQASTTNTRQSSNFGKALMLGIAYGASIGGLGTLIGTPTNAIFAAVVRQLYQADISFALWMLFGIPLSAIFLLICWLYLTRIAYPLSSIRLSDTNNSIQQELTALAKVSVQEKRVLLVFGLTALAWITRSLVLNRYIPALDDTIISLTGAICMFILPAGKTENTKLLDWEAGRKLPWGLLLLFGGGLAIAAGFKESGLAAWIGQQLVILKEVEFILLLLAVIFIVNFLTEITSNVATATVFLPVMASLSQAIGVHPYSLMVATSLAASCAFMLPVATPPNAIVFGSGYFSIKEMARTGFWLNILSVILLTLYVYYLLPLFWEIPVIE
jgi:solute carrier family 13 (sodium-dependent dicarboxylate transporter), member 2/3/5